MQGGPHRRTDWTGPIIVLILSPVLLFFIYIGKGDLGRSVAVGLGMILLAIRARWDLRGHAWFWATVVFVLALHIPLFLVIRWPPGWTPGVVVWPFAVVDVVVILGTVRLVETFMAKVGK